MIISNFFYQEPQVKLAEMLKDITKMDKVFFCNSGSETTEGATKLANALVDKGVNYLINGPSPTMAAAGMKKRGRPRKKKSSSFEHEEHCEHYKGPKGGKFNFVKTMNKIASNPIVKKIGNKALDTAVNVGTNALIMGAMGAGMKKKRQPSNRNLLIKQIMQKERCSLAEASKYIKSHNLKY